MYSYIHTYIHTYFFYIDNKYLYILYLFQYTSILDIRIYNTYLFMIHIYIYVYSGITNTPMISRWSLQEKMGCLSLYVFRWGVIHLDDFQEEFGSRMFYFQKDGEISWTDTVDVGMLNVMVLFTGLYFYGCFCRKNERKILLCRRRRCCHTSVKLTDVDSWIFTCLKHSFTGWMNPC